MRVVSCQLAVCTIFCEHADMLMLARLMSEYAEFQFPGLVWSSVVIDWSMGVVVVFSGLFSLDYELWHPLWLKRFLLFGGLLTHGFYTCTNFDNPEFFAFGMVEVSVIFLIDFHYKKIAHWAPSTVIRNWPCEVIFSAIIRKRSTLPKGVVLDGYTMFLAPRVLWSGLVIYWTMAAHLWNFIFA